MVTPLDDSKIPWIGFNLVKGIGPMRLNALITAFGDVQQAWNAPASQLKESGLNPRLVSSIIEVRESGTLEKSLKKIREQGIEVLTWEDPDYPGRLKEIDQSPPVLYCLGSMSGQDHWAIAVVGTRKVSAYGKQAMDIVSLLAQNGITIVSGLARGIDGVAHLSSPEAGQDHRRNGERLITFIHHTPPAGAAYHSERGFWSAIMPLELHLKRQISPRNRIISGLLKRCW
jgi:DNA processing protein